MLKNKRDRLIAIKDIIINNVITCQELLLSKLLEKGFDVTQATLSRDIKELKIAKMPDGNDSYRYVLPNFALSTNEELAQNIEPSRVGVRSVEFSGNLAVLKTQPGYASVAASMIDNRQLRGIIGTLAGDDTVLLVLHENFSRENVIKILSDIIPDIKNRVI